MAEPHSPLLDALLPDHAPDHLECSIPAVQEEPAGEKSKAEYGKSWRRLVWVILATVGCFAVLYHPTTNPSLFTEQANLSSASGNELKRVTHYFRSGDENQLLPVGEVASNLHRTSFHFQPEKNWMNDPNGPMYYRGYYHFFYQYNPTAAVWGYDIVWGHAVSTDLIHWLYLDIALVPDQWYDARGVWSGSVTLREDGVPVILYTGASNALEQTQNMAMPEDVTDPLLRKWVKSTENPLLRHPPGIDKGDFRDPTTAWKDEVDGGHWLLAVGAKLPQGERRTGLALLYKSEDLIHWHLHDNNAVLHEVEDTGMWECVDFYPVAVHSHQGLESYVADPAVKYVLKASLDEDRRDYYALGTYDVQGTKFHPYVDPRRDCGACGLGLLYDHGKFYASKTFYDPVKARRILWGWVNESDSEAADIAKGWSSVQSIPRVVFYNYITSGLIQVPIEEVLELRGALVSALDVELAPGTLVQVKGANGAQLDIEVEFEYPNLQNLSREGGVIEDDDHFECKQGGAAHRGLLGPFGLLLLADANLQEQTAVFFYVSLTHEGKWRTRFCSDQSRSSLLPDVDTSVYGSVVEVLPSDDFLSLRVLVDRSIVESFVQGGRMVITSRVYPIGAVDQAAHVYLFNNATTPMKVKRIAAWHMHSVLMHHI